LKYPPLLKYKTIAEYRAHYERMYCRSPIETFDNIMVRFRKSQFDHSFLESTQRNQVKDQFSTLRAERLEWIKTALQDPEADLYVGWDRIKKQSDSSHRVAVVVRNYVVVIRLTKPEKAQFVTAYVADSEYTILKIRQSSRWKQCK